MIRRSAIRGGIRTARGFTLLEVLLSFVIFALSFATVLEIMGASVRSATRARDYTEAALLAQSLMDMVGTEIPLVEGAVGGEAHGGYRWELVIAPYQPLSENDRSLELADVAGTLLYWVDLDIEWGDQDRPREARFTTVRAVLANQQQ